MNANSFHLFWRFNNSKKNFYHSSTRILESLRFYLFSSFLHIIHLFDVSTLEWPDNFICVPHLFEMFAFVFDKQTKRKERTDYIKTIFYNMPDRMDLNKYSWIKSDWISKFSSKKKVLYMHIIMLYVLHWNRTMKYIRFPIQYNSANFNQKHAIFSSPDKCWCFNSTLFWVVCC